MSRSSAAALLLLQATACATTQLSRQQLTSEGQLLFNGYVTDKADCHRCHGGAAQGTWKAPSLTRTRRMTDAEVLGKIDSGPGIMPAYRDRLTAEQKRMLVGWLREQFPPQP